jgi:hypothetical protein
MELEEIGSDGVGWIDVAQGPAESSCEHGSELSGSIRC